MKYWISGCLFALSMSAGAQQVAFTWDDLPAHSALPPGETRVGIGRKLIAAMKAEQMPPVYGFVNGVQTEREPESGAMLKEWRAAGLPLGNHTWSHMNLGDKPLADWEAEVVKNEPLLESLMRGQDWKWLRFPYLAEGSGEKAIAARAFLKGRGYRIAGVTMSFADYAYNEPYARCVAKTDVGTIAKLEEDYLAAADAELTRSRAMSKAALGREIPLVLLMHVGAMDAQVLPRLLKLYQQRGVKFVTLPEAEKDAFYANDLDLGLSAFPDSLEGAMAAKGLKAPAGYTPAVDLNAVCR